MTHMQLTSSRYALFRADLFIVTLIAASYLLVLLVMPITRDFASFDDWTYAHSAEGIVRGEGFAPSEYAQATLATHAYWGALFVQLFGSGFTSLVAATMIMSLTAAIGFYTLLRQLRLSPSMSGLGVAILTLNPYFLNLSYSFMTELTFLSLLILSCLFFILGISTRSATNTAVVSSTSIVPTQSSQATVDMRWLWLSSVFTALTLLTRQFGIAITIAAVLWLILARKISWTRLAAVALIPLSTLALYYLWSSNFGPTYSGSVGREEILDLLQRPATWVTRFAHFFYLELALPGLLVPLFIKVRQWKVAFGAAVAVAVGVYIVWQIKYSLVARGESSINELSYSWLQPAVAEPAIIYSIGAALSVWLFVGLLERAWPYIKSIAKHKYEPEPILFFYIVGGVLFIGTFIVSLGFLDRYWLPIIPMLIAAGLHAVRSYRGKLWLVPTVVILTIIALYGIAIRIDTYASLSANWRGGYWLLSQGIPPEKIKGGYSWDGYFLGESSIEELPSKDIAVIGRVFPPDLVIDPMYRLGETVQPGYKVIRTYQYTSWLKGLTKQEVYVMQRE